MVCEICDEPTKEQRDDGVWTENPEDEDYFTWVVEVEGSPIPTKYHFCSLEHLQAFVTPPEIKQ